MSDYTVISAVSNTLKEILKQNITLSPDAELNGIEIYLLSPKEMQDAGNSVGISVWLYKVSRMAEMLNEPPERIGPNQVARVPLPVLLFYLVTPITSDPETRHTLLGRVLQVLNDHAILRGSDLQGVLEGTVEQLRVNLEALSLEELSLVWEALSEPYQLSVTYLVQVAKIDSDLEPVKSSPVIEKEATYSQILSAQ
jgi:Pvc16 N-terminal domain